MGAAGPVKFIAAFAAPLLLAGAMATAGAAPPVRVVSTSLCTDQLALSVAAEGQIVSVHWLTRDPDDSAMAGRAAGIAANHGLAEEVLGAGPGLVFVSPYNSPFSTAMMDTLGLRVVNVPDALDYASIERNLRHVGAVLGRARAAEAQIRTFRAALAETRDALGHLRLRALVYGSGGYSAGVPSLFDETMRHVGLINLAADMGSSGWVSMSIEDVIKARPDVLIMGAYRPNAPSLASAILGHPALRALGANIPVIKVPTRLWNCGTPVVAQAARYLVAAIINLHVPGAAP